MCYSSEQHNLHYLAFSYGVLQYIPFTGASAAAIQLESNNFQLKTIEKLNGKENKIGKPGGGNLR